MLLSLFTIMILFSLYRCNLSPSKFCSLFLFLFPALKSSVNFQVTAGKIQVWSPGSDSLCSGSALTPVLYDEDVFSGCLLRLSLDDMRNCTFLREIVLTNQNRLIQATHVGRSGNSDLNVPDDWLPVIR